MNGRAIFGMLWAMANLYGWKSPCINLLKKEHVLTEFDLARIKKAQEKRARKNKLRLSRK